jgi:hypothetical protein
LDQVRAQIVANQTGIVSAATEVRCKHALDVCPLSFLLSQCTGRLSLTWSGCCTDPPCASHRVEMS